MANSNENTQNPKGDQEKMADKGIHEHSEHTAENKQPESKKTTTRQNLNRLKQQRKQIWQSKQKTDYLEIISKILGISAVLGIIIGGFITYFYLYKIDKLSIFPDTLLNASSLIAIITPFGLLSLILSLYFFSIYQLSSSIKTKSNRFESVALFSISLIVVFLFMWMLLNDYSLFGILVIYTLIALVFLHYDILNSRENLSPFQFFLVMILSILFLVIPFSNHNAILHSFRFIETPENPSWYLLHNNFQKNNGSQETNGIDKNDLLKLKQKFKCSKKINCSPIPEQRNNALYGYMAWNLGDTKVFCPPTVGNTLTVDDTKTEEEQQKERNRKKEQLAEECIVISGKALQIMPKGYISTNTDGIDDGNPDNTSHDDPAIDIKTDVRFKNDLNAQSNAGLNNFNVQPILPIQSNAKNMSIQINYGSCNHDSPRNKDGHPDLGYTDKKICQ